MATDLKLISDLHFAVLPRPLRSNQAKGGDAALVYRQLEGSGRIALVLYVAADVVVGPGK